jgi:RNA 2',3'-cyclic 3'-phosphodiesterase
MIRLFAAIPIPFDLSEDLTGRQAGLDGARWRPAEAFHITLRFIGEVQEPVADDIDSALAAVRSKPFALQMESVGAFGEGVDIHAVWAGVAGCEPLRILQGRCESALRRIGLAPDTRSYRPHVTLAYLNHPDPAAVADWLARHSWLKSPPFTVDRFGLYASHHTPKGSRYTLEREYRLG